MARTKRGKTRKTSCQYGLIPSLELAIFLWTQEGQHHLRNHQGMPTSSFHPQSNTSLATWQNFASSQTLYYCLRWTLIFSPLNFADVSSWDFTGDNIGHQTLWSINRTTTGVLLVIQPYFSTSSFS